MSQPAAKNFGTKTGDLDLSYKMNVLMGLGNALRGDDGIGVYISHRLKDSAWLTLDCGVVPENFSSVVKKHRPDILVIVDAADLRLKPGEFRIIPPEKVSSYSISTHTLSIIHLLSYLSKYAKKIIFIGIQPKVLDYTGEISSELKSAAEEIIELIKGQRFDEITQL